MTFEKGKSYGRCFKKGQIQSPKGPIVNISIDARFSIYKQIADKLEKFINNPSRITSFMRAVDEQWDKDPIKTMKAISFLIPVMQAQRTFPDGTGGVIKLSVKQLESIAHGATVGADGEVKEPVPENKPLLISSGLEKQIEQSATQETFAEIKETAQDTTTAEDTKKTGET